MVTLQTLATGLRARIVLADGTIAGEGYAGTEANAVYFACKDALEGGYTDAARGHAAQYPNDAGLAAIAAGPSALEIEQAQYAFLEDWHAEQDATGGAL